MNLAKVGLTLDTLGKIILGITVLLVHRGIAKEQKINSKVLQIMGGEQTLGITGIAFIILGYILQMVFSAN